MIRKSLQSSLLLLGIFFLTLQTVSAQKKVMWEASNISQKDLFHGPGGREMMPNLKQVIFLEEEKGGYNKKYRIKDASGKIWVAKIGREAQSETAAVRLMWALGYKSEINYHVKNLTIPGKGTFQDVRLEARPDNIKRGDEWSWESNPFLGTKELQGLRIMMVFLTNWDVGDFQNKILEVKGRNGTEQHYIISDLGATFGRLGNNNLPLIYRFGRQISRPNDYVRAKLVRYVEDGEVILAYKGKNRFIFDDIRVQDAEWLSKLLNQLSDNQIRDAFRAAHYTPEEITIFTLGVKNRIAELNRAADGNSFARKQ